MSCSTKTWDQAIQDFFVAEWWGDEMWQSLTTTPLILPLYALATVFHLLPYDWAPTRPGYACDSRGVPLQYTLNGLTVAFVVRSFFNLAPPYVQQSFYHNYWANLMWANAYGLVISLFFLLRGGREKYTRCITVDQVPLTGATLGTLTLAPTTPPPLLVRFFLGCEWNPRFFGVDVKMWLYLLGAVGLGANVLSFAATQQEYAGGRSSLAMTVYTSCFMWFLVDYLFNEDVHLYTYDIFAEKIGFKLAWGCLVFYPFFYGIGAFPLVRAATDISPAEAAATCGLFFVGWALTRGANLQKFYKRKNPESTHCFIGLVRQVLQYCSGECPLWTSSVFASHL
jgi:delta14-sterol reductase